MESRWRNLVILDYEVDFPSASRLELSLYSTGAALFPRIVLGKESLWGTHRRPGILDVPAATYDRDLDEFADSCVDPRYVSQLAVRLQECCSQLDHATGRLCSARQPTTAQLREVVDNLVELMAYHVFNWAVPLDDAERWLTDLTASAAAGRTIMMRLLVPSTSAHLEDFAHLATEAAHEMTTGTWTAERAAELSDAIGHLQAPGLTRRHFDEPAKLESYVRSLNTTDAAYLRSMKDARIRGERSLARETSLLYLLAGDTATLARTYAITAMCRLAAEEEEQRRRRQSRSLRAIGRAAKRIGLNLDLVLPSVYAADPHLTGDAPKPLFADDGSSTWGFC
ncbi:hypothetical protein [Streptomyces sp. NPDC096934]|uniref:hypothetical protein n=1 Tax=Streptomyces sp. NPDC096934 TaxID=3155551 RepID=UPI0033215BBD